jgi:uncharacterized delta-60 repeat protein
MCACGDINASEPSTRDLAGKTGAEIPPATGMADQTTSLPVVAVTGRPGSLDETFGPDGTGIARIKFGADDDGRFAALDVSDGRIVATGAGTGGLGEVSMATMRFTADGLPDPTWNAGAVVRTRFGTSSTGDEAIARAVGRQRDGRTIIIGTNHDAGSRPPCPCTSDLAAARLSPTDGAADPDFGSDGRATIDLGGDEDVHDGLVLGTDAIIAVGAKDGQFLVARLVANGALDTGFAAPAGYDRVVHGTASRADAVAVDHASHVVVAGTFVDGGPTALIVIRYLASGAHDPRFGTTGEVIIAGPASEQAVALRARGAKLYLASTASDAGQDRVRVRRLVADGSIDPGFGSSGIAEIPDRAALGMVVFPDGRIAVLTAQSTVVRLTASGAIDPLFGTNGEVAVSFGDASVPGGLQVYSEHLLLVTGGDAGGTPGPGTFGVVERIRM